ncbi:MAG: SUMF1/EgtB/PvdO family nonheme iron enzyme [Phycisphaerae bacterium]|nr:SUMF1/EgtB/PvdO family nonheme iron enzyme [Phycisphaerae bacterium]
MASGDSKEFPFPGLPWAQRAERIEQELRRVNLYEGHVLADVLLPPEGHPDHITGNHEDGMNNTGPYLAALCYKVAVTKDPTDQQHAKEAAQAIEKMEQVTGVPGCFCRSYYRTDNPLDFETRYFFPAEWHWSPTMPKTRWLGDPSSDSLTHLMEGCALYFDLAADEPGRQRIAALVDRVMTRLLTYNFRLTDVDGKMTLWGDFCPDSDIQELNALLALMYMRVAYHVTGKAVYERAYRDLVDKHAYHERAVLTRPLTGPVGVPWDNTLGMTGLYFVMKYETDRRMLGFYRAALERYRKHLRDQKIHIYDFVVQALSRDVPAVTRETYEYLATWNHAGTHKRQDGAWQTAGHGYLRQYWMGRYYGLIGPKATGAADAAAGTKPRTDLMIAPPWDAPGITCPEGMTYVPAGPFLMGGNRGDDDETPEHLAETGPFFIDVTPVTNAQWKKVYPNHTFDAKDADKPATGMSFEQAEAYAKALGKRLPTEVEWEKAARGSDGRLYPWGSFWDPTMETPDDRWPVAQQPWTASPYGCQDMAGNVWQWTSSWYQPYDGNKVPSEQYGEKFKVIRGGASFSNFSFKRASHRYYVATNTRSYGYAIGLRCVKDAPK